jgi:hypothetical protein
MSWLEPDTHISSHTHPCGRTHILLPMLGLRFNELLIVLVLTAPTIWALIDIIRIPTDVWAGAKQSQGLWVLLVVLVPVLTPILYLFVARPRLRAST